MKVLTQGTCVAFGSAYKIPMICKLDMPNPRPYSSSCDVSFYWDSKQGLNTTYEQASVTESVDTNGNSEVGNMASNINPDLLN